MTAIGLAIAACSKDAAPPPPAPPLAQPPTPPAPNAPRAPNLSKIKLTLTPTAPRVAGKGYAKRCVIAGDPLASDCVGGGAGLAFDAAGTLFVVDGKQVRRYTRAAGDDCRFDPAGDAIALPRDNPRAQPLDHGPVFMRSGGAAWHLVRAGDAIYAVDYLDGLFRVDHGTAEPVCTDVFGYESVAKLGKQLLVHRLGIEQLALGRGGHCTSASAHLDDDSRAELYAIRDHLYAAERGGNELRRFDGKTATVLTEGTRICSVTAITACGDGVCAFDTNCMALIQLDATGQVQRTMADDKLFDVRPWSLDAATTAADGTVYLLARHRDGHQDHAVCEAAIYALPSALFTD